MRNRYYVREDRRVDASGWTVHDSEYRHVAVERFPSRQAAREAARKMEAEYRAKQNNMQAPQSDDARV